MKRERIRRGVGLICLPALALVVASCGSGSPEGELLQLSYHAVHDPFGGDIEAFRFLAPNGWQVSGRGMVWNIGLRNGGVSAELDVSDPNQPRGFGYLPYSRHHWNEPQVFAEGQIDSTVGSIVTRPLSAVEYLELVAIPEHFPPDTQVFGSQQLPEVAEAVAQAGQLQSADAARSRVFYSVGDQRLEAHVYAWISYAGNPSLVTWEPELLYVVYAAAQNAGVVIR